MRLTATLALGCLVLASPLARADTKEEQVAAHVKELKSKDAATRKRAAEAIGKIAQIKASAAKPALQPLLDLLKDKDADVRATTATALGRLDQPKDVVPALAKLLKAEKESKVKAAAAVALGVMGEASKEALPELRAVAEQARKDDDRRLRQAAGEAIRQISGRPAKKN
jgi:HEAT repeat protein